MALAMTANNNNVHPEQAPPTHHVEGAATCVLLRESIPANISACPCGWSPPEVSGSRYFATCRRRCRREGMARRMSCMVTPGPGSLRSGWLEVGGSGLGAGSAWWAVRWAGSSGGAEPGLRSRRCGLGHRRVRSVRRRSPFRVAKGLEPAVPASASQLVEPRPGSGGGGEPDVRHPCRAPSAECLRPAARNLPMGSPPAGKQRCGRIRVSHRDHRLPHPFAPH